MTNAKVWVTVLVLLALGGLGGGVAMGSPAGESGGGWVSWSPRAEIAPRFSREGDATLRIDCATHAEYGVWRRVVDGIVPGKSYRVRAFLRARNVPDPALVASARLDWRRADGEWARPPDYLPAVGVEDGWTKLEQTVEAPEGAATVRVELAFGWAPHGTVWWDRVTLVEAPPAAPRRVRVATVFDKPSQSTPDGNVERFCGLAEGAADRKPDVVLFPEAMRLPGTGKNYAEVSEPIPGPTTERLGQLARKLHAYVVGGLLERCPEEGRAVVYNTAVLIDRSGKLVGTYRKTHLPREEVEGGVTPGNSYPVFDTDFGRVGLAVCWDTQFPEPIRAMALQGAELILVPIAGGSDILVRARAIENHVYLATSSYDMATYIVDPTGTVLAQATSQERVAYAEIDLNRKIVQPWLGDMKVRTWRERRPDIPLPRAYGR